MLQNTQTFANSISLSDFLFWPSLAIFLHFPKFVIRQCRRGQDSLVALWKTLSSRVRACALQQFCTFCFHNLHTRSVRCLPFPLLFQELIPLKSPTLFQITPTFLEKPPTFSQISPSVVDNSPIFPFSPQNLLFAPSCPYTAYFIPFSLIFCSSATFF